MTGDGAEEYLTRAVLVPLGPTPAHERLPPKQGPRKGRPGGFPRACRGGTMSPGAPAAFPDRPHSTPGPSALLKARRLA